MAKLRPDAPVDPNRPRLEQARELAGQIVGRIKLGGDFEQLAKKYSQETTSKDKGGDDVDQIVMGGKRMPHHFVDKTTG